MSNPKGNLNTLRPYQPKWKKGETKLIRVPIVLVDELMVIAKRLDNDEPLTGVPDLTAALEQVLSDPVVTRNGKDTGAVRRALTALQEVLRCKPL